tara:strand:- start:51 stop:965 length:915 start_codon:yes stop_codon:yes gene_type:complete
LESKKSDDILGLDFYCLAEPEPEVCPAKEGEYIYNEDRGSYKCPYCMKVFNWDVHDDRDLFDEEEDEDSGPMNEDADFTPEGINIQQDFSRDFDLRVDREDSIMKLVEKLEDIDNKLAVSINKNTRQIIDIMRSLENANHSAFRIGLDINPKVIAIHSHIVGTIPNRDSLLKIKIRPETVYGKIRILKTILTPGKDERIKREFIAIAKLIDMPESLALAALEEFERYKPISPVIIPYARHTAWLFVMGEKYGWSITQKDLIGLSNSPRNATRQAIKDFRQFLSNLNNANASEDNYVLKRDNEVE